MPRPITPLLYSLLSSFLLASAYPPVDLGAVAWVALVPLFMSLEGKTARQRFLLGFITGCFFFLGSLFWLRYVTWAGLFLLSCYLALYIGLFSVWAGSCLRHLPPPFQGPSIAGGWVVLEWLRSRLLTGFGWNLLGYSQWHWLTLIQIADLTGTYGISFLVVMGNVSLFFLWKVLRGKRPPLLWSQGLTAILIFTSCLYGSVRLRQIQPSRFLKIGLVQGNIPQSLKWDPSVQELILTKYERLTKLVSLNEPRIIFWPETSVPGILPLERQMLKRLRNLAKQNKVFMLIGAPWQTERGITNSAFLVNPQGDIEGQHHKLHLVPFGEYIPFEKRFPFLRNWIETGDFIAGKEVTVFGHPDGPFSVLVCFEDIFPELSRDFVRRGARYLVNITNDAWFHRSAAPYQHAQASVFRAVENRVPVVRAANTGLSCVIDAKGQLLGTIGDETGREIEVTGSKTFTLPLMADPRPSFYTRHGDLFAKGWCLVMVSFAAVLWGTPAAYRRRNG